MQLYFLCTGNSCRSQMAEGFAKELAPADWRIASAGTQPHGINPLTIESMAAVGIDISQQTSDLIDPQFLNQSDYVITLCGDARDNCPMTPPHVQHLHWDLTDPAQVTGDLATRRADFVQTRDTIQQYVQALVNELQTKTS
ncbi:arsenate reductase [Weissella uvarum]|uniref:arsenate reductase (thioredoxin) n=1 Tax=Weissella uvarum TaxID=1479233 RepID=UPI0019605315|nr:arsenate reductase (thioredoxin) [Weissella uvarum]MBM7617620.1 arsenate reductase [Weissella uvarum]MCM0595970.1 arsenate reductase (thioredoxin) [Weissella uvarum]